MHVCACGQNVLNLNFSVSARNLLFVHSVSGFILQTVKTQVHNVVKVLLKELHKENGRSELTTTSD